MNKRNHGIINMNNKDLIYIGTLMTATALSILLISKRWTQTTMFCKKYDDESNNVVEFQSGQVEPKHGGNDNNNNNTTTTLHVPYHHQRLSIQDIRIRAQKFLRLLSMRRTIRFFSSDPIPKDIIETIIQTAATAPSGAHKQPWSFVAVSNPEIKAKIRIMVEEEETINYQRRMRKSWVKDVEGMVSQVHASSGGTSSSGGSSGGITETATATATSGDGSGSGTSSTSNDTKKDVVIQKPYLTEAPWLIVVFKQPHGGIDPITNERIDHYYVQESVGIACGMLISAIQNANLATLTSTPMGAEKGIRNLLGRPEHEKVVLLMPVGFPANHATVPYRHPERKPLDQVLSWKC